MRAVTLAIGGGVAALSGYMLYKLHQNKMGSKSPSSKKKKSKGNGSKKKSGKQLTAPSLDEACYVECFEYRRRASNMTQNTAAWVAKNANLLMYGPPAEDAQELKEERQLDDSFHVLSIGAADGEVDLELIKALAAQLHSAQADADGDAKSRKLHFVALTQRSEPIQPYVKRFKERLDGAQQRGELHHKDMYYVLDKKFEDKPVGTEASGNGLACNKPDRFDLVVMVNVMQYFRDPNLAIKRAMHQTKRGGQLVIVQPAAAGVPGIQSSVLQDVKGHEKNMLTGEDLKRMLKQNRLNFHFEQFDSYLNVSDCLKRSNVGVNIMSSCLECDLRRLCEPKMMKVVQAFWKQAHIDEDSGEAFVHEPLAVFVISKPMKKKEESSSKLK